jgi:hypothetical protein
LLREPHVEGLGDLFGLADPAAFDYHVVELGEFGEAHEFFEEVAAESAADAAVLEGDYFALCAGEAVAAADCGGVDVDSGGFLSVCWIV